MKRKLKWLAIVLAVSPLGFGAALFLWPRDRITVESWRKIQLGMMEKEVQEILGGPGMNEEGNEDQIEVLEKTFDKLIIAVNARPVKPPSIHARVAPDNWIAGAKKVWVGRYGFLRIEFDQKGQVKRNTFFEYQQTEPTFVERVQDWLGW